MLNGPPCINKVLPTFLPIYLRVVTDASPVSLGAILLQDQGPGERKPTAYISRSLTSTERRYIHKLSAKC